MFLECNAQKRLHERSILSEVVRFPDEATTQEHNFTTTTVARNLEKEPWAVSLDTRHPTETEQHLHGKDRVNTHGVAGRFPMSNDTTGNSIMSHKSIPKSSHRNYDLLWFGGCPNCERVYECLFKKHLTQRITHL